MPHADFIHLRVHTAYSLSEGAIRVKELVALCQAQRMPAVAIADTGNLFGALEFSTACAEAGIQPIIGVQLGLRREDAEARPGARRPEPESVVLLAKDEGGYRNLLKLVSKSYLETAPGEAPQVAVDDLAARSAGLLLLTGGAGGPVGRRLAEGQDAAAEALLLRLADAFPGRLYVELQRHGLEVEERVEPGLLDFAYRHDLPLLATNEPFFPGPEMYEAHDALLCIAEGTYVAEENRRRLTPEHHFKSAEAMRALFADLPEAVDNTLVVARRCAFMVEKVKPILPPFATEHGEVEELRRQAREGLERRLEVHLFEDGMDAAAREAAAAPYRDRLAYELGIIEQMGFPGYFLIVSDFIKWAKAQGIPVGPGRGSGAGSVVAWALSITDLDPLRWGLLFERFLNPERVSMPDFDVDFCQDRREEVIRYVQDRYGHDKVAQIITFGKLQARAVLRDVGRVLQMPYGQVDRICKLVPNNPANPVTLGQALDSEPMLREQRDRDEGVAYLIDQARKLEGLYRHASTHAAGVVIGDRPLDELVPLYRDPRSDMPVTQFNMKWVESAGLVKFDFLGLKTLTVLATAVRLVAENGGPRLDLSALPLDDAPTYELLSKGDTVGVFQLESAGMRDVLRKLRPNRFEDIIAVVALYRPGPMDNIPAYIARKHGSEPPDYLHPKLEPILKETFGIMIYQEQVMQIAQELSGYSLGGADLLRRAMGKKIQAEMEQQRQVFVDGAAERGVEAAKAAEIFDQVQKFASYGFNKSHAAAYALVAYQTAWLKANYPVAFLAASMTLDLHNTDKLGVFRQELNRLGIDLLPPDVNRSRAEFTVEGEAIRYALAALKNVGEAAMQALVTEREANGPFASIADFADRLDVKQVNRRQLENLVKAGAFDAIEGNRRRLFEGIDTVLRAAAAAAEDRASNQVNLFGDGAGVGLELPRLADWPPADRLGQEFDAVGFYLSAHPLDAYETTLKRLGVQTAAQLPAYLRQVSTGRVKMAGTVLARKERTNARGNRFAFVALSDTSGIYEVMLFSEVLAQARDLLEANQPLLLTVDAREEDGQMRLTCQKVQSLDAAAAKAAKGVKIVIDRADPLPALKELVAGEARGRGRVFIVPRRLDREVEVEIDRSLAVSPRLVGALRSLPGVVEVVET